MSIFLQQVFNGLSIGALYALVSVGLTLIFGVLEVVNFAHGQFFMLASFCAFFLSVLLPRVPYPLLILLTSIAMGIFGGLYAWLVICRLIERSWKVSLLATLATSIIMTNLAIFVWGAVPRIMTTPFIYRNFSVAGVSFNLQRVIILGVALLSFFLLQLFIQKTKPGKAMRAISQNREASSVVGIRIEKMALLTFVVGAGLCGLSGALVGPVVNIYPNMGYMLNLKAFAVVIMGGFGNVKGAVYSAFILGVAEALAAGYITTDYVDAISFGLLILVLLFMPHGLFGKKVGI